MASSSRGSGTDRKGKITVRHGAALAHVQTVEAAADLMRLVAVQCAGQQQQQQQPHGWLDVEAQRVLLAAVGATHLLGCGTVAKGWQVWKQRRPPSELVRDVRNLDAAAALLRHPGAADDILHRLREWIEASEPLDLVDVGLGNFEGGSLHSTKYVENCSTFVGGRLSVVPRAQAEIFDIFDDSEGGSDFAALARQVRSLESKVAALLLKAGLGDVNSVPVTSLAEPGRLHKKHAHELLAKKKFHAQRHRKHRRLLPAKAKLAGLPVVASDLGVVSGEGLAVPLPAAGLALPIITPAGDEAAGPAVLGEVFCKVGVSSTVAVSKSIVVPLASHLSEDECLMELVQKVAMQQGVFTAELATRALANRKPKLKAKFNALLVLAAEAEVVTEVLWIFGDLFKANQDDGDVLDVVLDLFKMVKLFMFRGLGRSGGDVQTALHECLELVM